MIQPHKPRVRAGPVAASPVTALFGLLLLMSLAACRGIPLRDGYYSCDPGVAGSCPDGMTCAWDPEAGEYRCFSTPPGDAYVPVCGNGDVDQGEQCDGQNLGGQTCEDLGHPGGTLACSAICTFDRSGCDPPVTCGDGDIDPPAEQCDGSDLGGATCESLGYVQGTLGCLANCTYDFTQCATVPPPTITGIDGTGDASSIAPRPEDQAAYNNTPNKVDGNRRIDGNARELVITGTNLDNPLTVTAEGQTGQGTIDFEIQPGGTDTMLRARFPQVMTVTAGGLFLLTLLTDHGQAQAQVFFLQGQDGVCTNTVTGDLTVTGNISVGGSSAVAGDQTVTGALTVEGSYELPDCPSGYERDPAADPSIIVCVHPTSGDEMVKVGDFWVDRYEATVFASPDCTGTPLGSTADDWAARAPDFPHNGNWTTKYYACSVPGVTPSRWVTWFMAQAACAAQGKHLITNAEWQVAAEGTFDPGQNNGIGGGPCHTWGSGPRPTGMAGTEPGGTTSCISRWGTEDMIGGVWEWTANWYGQGGNANDGSMTSAEYGQDGYWNVDAAESQGTAGTYFPATAHRGGTWDNGVDAGIFQFNLQRAPSFYSTGIGVRCARSR